MDGREAGGVGAVGETRLDRTPTWTWTKSILEGGPRVRVGCRVVEPKRVEVIGPRRDPPSS